ncbi:hypothetical protein OAO40_05180 [Amylibacter sp.]|jgi:hypothetical protein|nr:hypothetical protein [Amylibacter sp.]
MIDKYTKIVMTIIAVGLWVQILQNFELIGPVKADDYHIISRILFCIDGSSISGGSLSTYCNG